MKLNSVYFSERFGPLEPTKYHSIDDIPDELVRKYSKRDPDNKIYQTNRWMKLKKYQILYQQNDGVPAWKRTRLARINYYSLWAATWGVFFWNIYTWNKLNSGKK